MWILLKDATVAATATVEPLPAQAVDPSES